jgi:hypothetical protein
LSDSASVVKCEIPSYHTICNRNVTEAQNAAAKFFPAKATLSENATRNNNPIDRESASLSHVKNAKGGCASRATSADCRAGFAVDGQ